MYGSIVAITVPIPDRGSYRSKNATIRAKYDIIGAMTFDALSPIRYATWVSSGAYPSSMNIGTKTGAITAHFADALPMTRLISAESRTNASMSGMPPSPEARSASAPLTAMIRPRFDQLKYATNCAAKKTSTRYVPSAPSVLPIPFITSASLRNVPAPAP